MGKAAKFDSDKNFKVIQEALNYLACKAQAILPFNDDEKEFMVEIYEAFWWGGHYQGLKEAAKLANHYVHGAGKRLNIDPEVYKQAPVVQATAEAMKKYLVDLLSKGLSITNLKSSNPGFYASVHARAPKNMNYRTEGKLKSGGVLEAAQNNNRLHKTDGHFYLEARTIKLSNKKYTTTWIIESLYDFEPFSKHQYYTEIPLGKKMLIIYDGLSEYMEQLGIAKKFWYEATWVESWEK